MAQRAIPTVRRNFLGLNISTGVSDVQEPENSPFSLTPFPTSNSTFLSPQSSLPSCSHNRNYSNLSLHPGRRSPSPSRLSTSPRSPTTGDRFIANRSTTNFELSGHRLSPRAKDNDPANDKLNKTVFSELYENTRILSFASPGLRSLNTASKDDSKPLRKIMDVANRILDAPNMTNNFFLGAIDWSKHGVIAAALGCEVYLYKTLTAEINSLPFEEKDRDTEITCVKWNKDGTLLAVSNNYGLVTVWSSERKLKFILDNHDCYVSALAWRGSMLVSGDTDGLTVFQRLEAEIYSKSVKTGSDIICALAWSHDGSFMANGTSIGSVYICKTWPLGSCN